LKASKNLHLSIVYCKTEEIIETSGAFELKFIFRQLKCVYGIQEHLSDASTHPAHLPITPQSTDKISPPCINLNLHQLASLTNIHHHSR
jgi:hypothetical protein